MGEASIGHLNTCARPGCLCQTDPGQRYCGDYCGRLSQDGDKRGSAVPPAGLERCGCNHSACEEPRV
jgi:hypothetical protein